MSASPGDLSKSTSILGTPTLLGLPVEIRLNIYTLLFLCASTLRIEPASPSYQQALDDEQGPSQRYQIRISPVQFCRPAYLKRPFSTDDYGLGLTSQLLLTCRQIYSEALPLIYSLNKFDCSLRSAPQIFYQIISVTNFAMIRHLLLDWDQLQDFAWSLSKDSQVSATAGLEVLELAYFRRKALRHPRWEYQRMDITDDPPKPSEDIVRSHDRMRERTKDHERQLHQAALEITQRHARLRYLVQETCLKAGPRGYQRERVSTSMGGRGYTLSRPIVELTTSERLRWRFVSEKALHESRGNGTVLDIVAELTALEVNSSV
jgi:hypothetical protein